MQLDDMIKQLLRGDPQGAERLMTHYGPLMKYVIAPILPNAQDREECLSEAAMRVVEKITLYDPAKGSWTAWLTAVTRRTALNKLRSLQAQPNTEQITPQIPSPGPTPEENILQQERLLDLHSAIASLSQSDQRLFYRKYYYLQSTAQIARESGLSERAVEGRLYRIKKRLRKLLGGDGNG